MDNLYDISDSKLSKRSSMSPAQKFGTPNPYYHYKSPVIDQYRLPDNHTTSLKTVNSPFLRYLQSARSLSTSPSSIGDHHQPSIGYKYNRSSVTRGSQNSTRLEPSHTPRSPLLFRNTAVKVEEDVLVMDGVVVKNPPVDRGRSSPSSLADSGGSSSSSSSSSASASASASASPGCKNYKLDLCLSYLENSGYCRYGTKCQFAHGNKELRTSQYSYKSTPETPCKNYSITATPSTPATSTTQTVTPVKLEEVTTNIANLKTTDDWCPLDDRIDICTKTGDTLTREDFDALMHKFIHGPKKSKRLPVFTAICPE